MLGAQAMSRLRRAASMLKGKKAGTQHQLSTRIVRENQVICVESLAVKNMIKNHCLAKSISDVGWGELVRQLEYKCAWYGRTLVKIDRWYPLVKPVMSANRSWKTWIWRCAPGSVLCVEPCMIAM